jgi:RNA polymerase sigma-70 factor (ECF subfamily)
MVGNNNQLNTDTFSANLFLIKNRADFEMLFKAHYSSLCSYADGFLKNLEASEDVVQDVMFRIWTGRETLVIETSVRSYLFRAVRNGCMNVLKHHHIRGKYRSFRERETMVNQRSPEEEMIIMELEEKIWKAIDQLPLERRKVFIMNRYDRLTYNQIAIELGISVKTVENQMSKALSFLREELSDLLPWLVLLYFNLI